MKSPIEDFLAKVLQNCVRKWNCKILRKMKNLDIVLWKPFGLEMCHKVEIFFGNHHQVALVSIWGAELGCYCTVRSPTCMYGRNEKYSFSLLFTLVQRNATPRQT